MNQPSFDNWTTAFLLFSFLGFITSILIQFQSKQNRMGKFLISLLLILFSLTLVDYVLYWTRYQIYFPHFAGISTFFFLLFGPIVLLYVESVQSRKFNKKNLIHFIPFCIAILFYIPYLIQSAEQKKLMMLNGLSKDSWYPIFFKIVAWFSIIQIFWYSIIVFDKRKTFFEFPLIKKWVMLLSLGLAGIAGSFLTYMVLVRFRILKLEWDYMIALAMVLFIATITIVAFLKPYVFDDLLPQMAKKKQDEIISKPIESPILTKYRNSPIDEKASKELAEKLDTLMIETAFWRKSDLRLNDLAIKMELPKEYISQIINEQFNRNFFEFVNRYRIEDAKTLINSSQKEVTLIEIAYQVGFNNKVSFGKAFKASVNMSPIEYKRSLQKSEAIAQTHQT